MNREETINRGRRQRGPYTYRIVVKKSVGERTYGLHWPFRPAFTSSNGPQEEGINPLRAPLALSPPLSRHAILKLPDSVSIPYGLHWPFSV